MSDPADDIPGRKKPRRAEPGQPDNPLSGNEGTQEDASSDVPETDQARRQKEQSDAALDNVRNDT